nr:uncharacterized protein LOC131794169 [Pocillopora verrucosa]XP_058967679.1 uncharacterized protein LOC131794169 [Pocillopora verrucosa]XP_058967680.1 uncharacterized protein LOC131794169 [Pocillopora verrucosa]
MDCQQGWNIPDDSITIRPFVSSVYEGVITLYNLVREKILIRGVVNQGPNNSVDEGVIILNNIVGETILIRSFVHQGPNDGNEELMMTTVKDEMTKIRRQVVD